MASPRWAGTQGPPALSGGKTGWALQAAGAAYGQAAHRKFFHPYGNSWCCVAQRRNMIPFQRPFFRVSNSAFFLPSLPAFLSGALQSCRSWAWGGGEREGALPEQCIPHIAGVMVLKVVFGFNSLPPHCKSQFFAISLPKTCNVSLSIPSTPISLSTKGKNPNRLGLVTALAFCEFLQLCNANLIFYKQLGRGFSGSKNHGVNLDFFLPSHHHFLLVLPVRRIISHLKDLLVHNYLQTPFVQQRWWRSALKNKTPGQRRNTEHTLRWRPQFCVLQILRLISTC